MATFQINAWSPGLPADDVLAHPEGGPEAAMRAAARLFPGQEFVWQHTGTWSDPGIDSDDALLLSTYGPTTLALGRPPSEPAEARDLGSFTFLHQTASMSYAIEVHTAEYDRTVILGGSGVEHEDGASLPFEGPFWAGERNVWGEDEPIRFDVDEFAAAATRWMVGYSPARPGPEDQVDMWGQPVHVLTFRPGPG